MAVDRLREFHKATPFRPFVLHLADGRDLRVGHPELIAMSPNGHTAAVFGPKDSLEVVDLVSCHQHRVGQRYAPATNPEMTTGCTWEMTTGCT